MSKKHFIALADAIREHNAKMHSKYRQPFTYSQLDTLAHFCARQNCQFKRKRWFEYIAGACGPSGGAVKRPKEECV